MSSKPQISSSSAAITATALLCATLGTGCATSYHVDIDALQNPRAIQSGYSYRIETTDPAKSTSDAHYAEVAALVRTALSGRGMYEAAEGEDPSVIVDLDYGVGPMQTRLVPTGIPESVTPRQNDPFNRPMGSVTDPRMGGTMTGATSGLSDAGYREEYTCEKYLTIVGRDNTTEVAAGQPRVELWRVHVTVEDEGDDIANYLTVLTAAAADYIGTDTQEKQRLRVSEDDEVVDFVKQGL